MIEKSSSFHLDESDYQVLNLLYKPLIGNIAYDLYHTFYELLKGKTSATLNTLLLIDLMSHTDSENININKAIKVLASFKLLKIKTNTLYELYPPYNFTEFISSSLLEYYSYKSSLVEKEYVSKVFNYEFKNTEKTPNIDDILSSLKYKTKKNKNTPFSFKVFKETMKESGYEISDEDEDFITSLSILYNLNLDNMCRLFFESSDDTSYTRNQILNRINEKYIADKEKENKKKNASESELNQIEFLKNTKPEELLRKSSKGVTADADLMIIQRLREKRHLSDELISLLIAYSLATGDNKIKSYSFFEKIAIDWKKRNINDIESAFFHINELYKAKENKKSSEEWFEDYWDKIVEEKKNGA